MIDYNCSITLVTGIGIGLVGGYLLRTRILSRFLSSAEASIKSTPSIIRTSQDLYKAMSRPTKLVLVVRDDLKMGKGKIAAQCSHASVMAYCKSTKHQPALLKQWELTGQMKVVVKCDNEEVLFDLKRKAEASNLLTSLVCDAGHTQVAPSTYTVLAIGPASKTSLDLITGHLKLL